MNQLNYAKCAPHMKDALTTDKIMKYILLALAPAGIHGVYRYGIYAGLLIVLTCVSAAACEWCFEKALKKPVQVKNCRVLVTGLIMSYCLPPSVSWYIAVIAGILCALIMQVSLHFLCRNIVSPVILARLILMFAFQSEMTTYVFDGLTMATPLSLLKQEENVNTLFMILGRTGGCIGETSALLLCIGAIFLIMKGIMDFRITGMCLFSFAAFMAIFGGHGLSSYYLTAHLAGGGFMLALWYIMPDYSTLPITKDGRWIYGALLGLLTGVSRLFGPSVENICFAVLIANLFVPLIEKLTIRRPFGIEKGHL